MCCKRNQNRALGAQYNYSPQRRGCCGSRLAQSFVEARAAASNTTQGPIYYQEAPSYGQRQRPTMAALLAVGIGLGAEKLGRSISEKRLERKEKKAIAKHEATYGSAGSSSEPMMTTRERESRTEKKRNEAQRELNEARSGQDDVPLYTNRRRSTSAVRVSEEELPPPSYNDVVQQDARRS